MPGDLNAFTTGVKKQIIVLNAGLIDAMTEGELFFVIGHELGHIKSGHVLYSEIARLLPAIVETMGAATMGITNLLSKGFRIALVRWQQMSELTADRAGFLACQDVNAAIGAMIKLAGLPLKFSKAVNSEDFIAQAREFQSYDSDKLDWITKFLIDMGQSHPWTVMRAHEFLGWIDSGEYDRILSNPQGAKTLGQATKSCSNTDCRATLSGQESFCTQCGTKISIS
jgi:Zn-dependent protease with chaperone function